MPLLVHVKRNQSYNWVIEDPDPRYSRIFVENQALNVGDLTPRPGEFFWHSDNTWTAVTTAAADWKDWPVVLTVGKFGNSWADSRQAWPAGIGRWDPWLLFLDYNFTPQKIIYASTAGRWYMFYPRDITGDNMRQDVWVGENLETFAQTRTTTQNDWTTPIRLREDGNWIGIDHNNNTTAVVLMRMDPAGLTIYNIRTTTNLIHFYMGADNFGTDYFLEVNCSTSEYSVFRAANPSFTGSGVSTSTSTVLTGVTGGNSGNIYQFPSNFVSSNSDYCTFYSSHYTSLGVLEPRKLTWNKLTGQVNATTCSVIYPGVSTFATYGQICSTNNFNANSSNTWWIKPHVFVKNNIKYISFLVTEKSVHYFINERFSDIKQRAWITYSIGDGDNDHQLTFHSVYNWATTYDMPRSWVPLTDAGDSLLVFLIGRVVKLDFSSELGWINNNTQSLDVRAYGIDSTGRVWLVNRGMASATQTGATADALAGTGYNSIYIYDTSTAENVSITMDQNSYNYVGNVISTTLTVNANNSKELAEYNNAYVTSLNPFGAAGVSWSITLDGTSDKIVAKNSEDFNFYLGNFTIEFWMYSRVAWSSQTNLCGVVGHKTADATQGWQIYRNSTQTNKLVVRYAGTQDFYSTADVGTAVWEHWALVRSGTNLRWFKNGVEAGLNATAGFNIYDYTSQLNVGFSQTWSVSFNGMISNLRILKGAAAYSGNFTPATSNLTSSQAASGNLVAFTSDQVKLLTFQSNTIVDTSGAHLTRMNMQIIGDTMTFDNGAKSQVIATVNGSYTSNVFITGNGVSYITAVNIIAPYWVTPAGNLPPAQANVAYSFQLLAVGDGALNYTVYSGSLPTGITLNSSSGLISGVGEDAGATANFAFVARVSDLGGAYQDRSFNITISTGVITTFSAEILLVAGGGGGGGTYYGGAGGGGGAGGILHATSVTLTQGTSLACTVGAGGAGCVNGTLNSSAGGNTSIVIGSNTYTAYGGGGGGSASGGLGSDGGSGGGQNNYTSIQTPQPPFAAYGSNGAGYAGGGGGAGPGATPGSGYSASNRGHCGGASTVGGIGRQFDITGVNTYYGGGGGGGSEGGSGSAGGLGGGGSGASACGGTSPQAGTAYTGGGGGGYGSYGGPSGVTAGGASGGSGVIIIKYSGSPKAVGGEISTVSGYTVHRLIATEVFYT